jgi:CheY-like chemotaxis protein
MAAPRKILIVDPDPSVARSMAPALRQRGYQVHGARDGTRALQVAILRLPDLVLFDEATPLLDARTFLRILRTNPRTERIPVVITGESVDGERTRLGAYLRKPFQREEVLARIDQIFRKVETARAVSSGSRELEGNLAQIPLVDLLQILAVNRKTGRLHVARGKERSEVALVEGRVVDARVGPVSGEKALFRMLSRREGQFAFHPGDEAVEPRIHRKLDDLLLEGARQADEMARLVPALPGPDERVELAVPPGEIPPGLHPVTEEVVSLLLEPRRLEDLLDAAQATDLEAGRAVAALLERGYARRSAGEPPEAAAFLGAQEIHALRARIGRGRAGVAPAVGKVVLVGGGPLSRRAALARLEAVPGFEAEAEGRAGFGTVGRVALGEGVACDLVLLPGEPSLRPLWRPFAQGAVGALVLLPAEGIGGLLEELMRGLRLPTVVCGPRPEAVPAELREGPGAASFQGPDPAEALRALLAGAGLEEKGLPA